MATMESPRGWSWPTRAPPILVFGVALVLLLALAVQLQQQSRRETQARQLVAHTLLVQKTLAQLESELLQVETEHRGYLVRGEPDFLRRREQVLQVATATLARLATLTADNPAQQARLQQVAEGVARRVARMREASA